MARGILQMLLIILRRRKYSDYVGEPNINRRIFIGGRQEGQSQPRMKTGVGMMYFEETMKQRYRWFQETGKGKEVNLPLELPEETQL